MKYYSLTIVTVLCMLLFASCEKQVSDIVDKEEKALAGKYTVSNYRVTVYDSLGVQLSQTNNTNYGSVELKMNTNSGADVFSHFIFYGAVRNTFVPGKLNKGQYCGEQDAATQMFAVHYQCDPYKKRMLLAAICPMETGPYYLDYTFNGKQLELFTRVVSPGSNQQTFYEYIFTKE